MSDLADESQSEPYGSAWDLPSFVETKREINALKLISRIAMRDKRAEFLELEKQQQSLADTVDAFYARLGPRHWTLNDWMSFEKVEAILRETTDVAEAERRLIELYQDHDAMKWHLARLGNFDGLRERHHLLVRAREDYDAGRFDSCTMLLIAVMDGFVNDFQPERRQGLAAREPGEMHAWDSVVGHQMGLTNALEPFLKTIKKRVDEEVFEVHRHGIVHGSVTNFNNDVVATKAWNLLFAVVDWSVSVRNKEQHDAEPAPQGLRDMLKSIASQSQKRLARERFEPWTIRRDDPGFGDDEIVRRTAAFVEAWQKGQWARIVPFIPHRMIADRGTGKSAEFAKSMFDSRTIAGVDVDRVEYTQSSVAEARGIATIDGTTADLLLRWNYRDSDGNITLNQDAGTWQLAVLAPHTYLVDENGDRLH